MFVRSAWVFDLFDISFYVVVRSEKIGRLVAVFACNDQAFRGQYQLLSLR